VDKPSVLVLTSTFPRRPNDTEPPFVFELCRRLAFRYDVHVIAPHAPGSLIREAIAGVQVHRFRYWCESGERLAYRGGMLGNLRKNPLLLIVLPFFMVAQLLSAIKLLRNGRVRVIHAHWILPQGLTAVLAKKLSRSRAAILCTVHGGDAYGLRGKSFDQIRRWVMGRVNRVTVVSRSLRLDLAKSGADPFKISVVPMGVDLRDRFVPPASRTEGGALLYVGRLVEKKGVRYLLEALPAIVRKFENATLTIVGDGPERPMLEDLAQSLGLQARVTFTGAAANAELPRLYQGADIMVFPSVVGGDGDREGFGLVLVEAMGCGCAAVVTDLPAMQDIVQDGSTAIVVGQKDPQAIAAAVKRLLGDPELRSALARAGRRHVLETFDWTSIVPRYGKILDGLIAEWRKNASPRT
jgi:glycosyltransferase involved in cell wall biosynthesis